MNSSLFSGVHPLEEGFFNLTWEHTQDIKYIPEVIFIWKEIEKYCPTEK